MDGNCGSWPDQYFEGQTPNFNSTSAWTRQYMGSQNQLSSYMYPWHPTDQDITLSSLAKPQLHCDYGEPHGWFYCLSTFGQAMFPSSNTSLKEQLSVESPATNKKDGEHIHNESQQLPHKQFLVFDQTGDQTTMIYSSGAGAPPVPCLARFKEKKAEESIMQPLHDGCNLMGSADTPLMDDSIDVIKFEEDTGSDLQSEMHEDTEELNALMYSDGDTDSDEDEVTSTDHSPSTLTIHDKQDGFAGTRVEVASYDEKPTKRLKIYDGGNGISLDDDHIIVSHGTFDIDDDTKSRCGSAELCNSGKTFSLSGKKRARNDTIRETVRKLQSIIPCGNASTPIEVIDEAINFLISLKLQAKSIGFDSTV